MPTQKVDITESWKDTLCQTLILEIVQEYLIKWFKNDVVLSKSAQTKYNIYYLNVSERIRFFLSQKHVILL